MTTNSNFRVKNNLQFTNTGTGITFADGTTQTTAASGSGGVSNFNDLTDVPLNLLNLATGTNVTLSTQVETSTTSSGGETFLALGDSLTDTSGNNITLTLHGSANFNQSVSGGPITGQNVFSFPGYNTDYISVPEIADFGTDDFTIDLWFYPEQYGNNDGDTYSAILSNWSAGLYFLYNTSENTQVYFFYPGIGTPLFASSTAPTLNAWNHLSLTRKSGVFKWWLNGALQATDSSHTGNSVDITGTWYIGSETGNARAFTGKMAGIRFLKGQTLWDDTFTPPSSISDYALHGGGTVITTSTILTSLTISTATVQAIKFSDNTVMTTAPTGGGSSYNQSLNTTDSVTFGGLRVNGNARMNAIIADDDTQKIVLSSNYTGEGSGAGGVLVVGSGSSNIGDKITLNAGSVEIQNLTYPSSDGSNGQVLTTNGSGVLSWSTVSGGGGGTGTTIDKILHINSSTIAELQASTGTIGDFVIVGDSDQDMAAGASFGYIAGMPAFWDPTNSAWTYINLEPVSPPQPTVNIANVIQLNYFDDSYTDERGNATLSAVSGNFTTTAKFGSHSLNSNGFGATFTNSLLDAIGTTGDFTIEAFVYIDNYYTGSNRGFIGVNSTSIFATSNGYLGTWNGTYFDMSDARIPLNEWAHIAWWRKNGDLWGSVNGQSTLMRVGNPINFYNSGDLRIGSSYYNESWYGLIDSLRITNMANYNGNFAPPTMEFPNS